MSPVPAESILDVLSGLIDKSLVAYEEQPDGTGRYRLLETVRQYAHERLAEGGGAEAVTGRHAAYFLSLAEQARPYLAGPAAASWLARLEAEHDNLRAGLVWYEQQPSGTDEGLRLAAGLGRFWLVRGYLTEGRQWLGRALRQESGAGQDTTALHADALGVAGGLAYAQGDYAAARDLLEEGLAIHRRVGNQKGVADLLATLGSVAGACAEYGRAWALYEESLMIRRQIGDQHGIAVSLNNLGIVAERRAEYAQAQALYEEGLAIARRLGDEERVAALLMNLGLVFFAQGDHTAARALYEESLVSLRRLRNQQILGNCLTNLGIVARHEGDFAAARALYEESLAVRRQIGDQHGTAVSLMNLGNVAKDEGEDAQARALYGESLAILRRVGDHLGIALSLFNLGSVALRQGRLTQAARLSGAAACLRETIGSHLSPADQGEWEQETSAVRQAIGEAAFAAAWVEGQAMGWEHAVEDALSGQE